MNRLRMLTRPLATGLFLALTVSTAVGSATSAAALTVNASSMQESGDDRHCC
jgi:hypothetical protein